MKADANAASLYTDVNGLNNLKRLARGHSSAAALGAAREFEAQFIQIMLQSMRQASPTSDLLAGGQSQFFRDLHDKQLAQNIAHTGQFGLAQTLARQLEAAQSATQRSPAQATLQSPAAKAFELRRTPKTRPLSSTPRAFPLTPRRTAMPLQRAAARPTATGLSPASKTSASTPAEFIARMRPHAEAAAAQLGVNPDVLLAQSALESGWGRHVLHHEGGSSHNLFGIKADHAWPGDHVSTQALEYEAGGPRRFPTRFRSYASYAQSFEDYVHFIRNNPRYAQALRSAGDPKAYLAALQEAGYATDPLYAQKVQQVMQHNAIRSTSTLARAGAPTVRA